MVLAGGPPHQGKAGERNGCIHQGLVWVEWIKEEAIYRLREIKAPTEHWDHPGAAVFQFLDQGHVMGVIAGNDVAALQHQANEGPSPELAAAGTPVQIFLEVFKHGRRHRVPDPLVGEYHRFGNGEVFAAAVSPWINVFIGQHQQHVAEVVWRSPQPILKAEHEGAGVLGLFHRQIFENRGQGI